MATVLTHAKRLNFKGKSMKKRQIILLTFLSLTFSITTSWATSPSLEKAVVVPLREHAEKITLFDKIPTNKGELLNVEVVLSFQSGPKQRTKYSSYQSILGKDGNFTNVYSDSGDIGPRSQYFDDAMAKKLALSRYQYQIRKGRKAVILSRINKTHVLPKEDIWALKKLGFTVPSSIRGI